MRNFVGILTAAGVLWHAVVGCCAHHDHGSQRECGTHQACGHRSNEEHVHGTEEEHHPEEGCGTQTQRLADASPPQHPATPCTEDRCAFAAGKIAPASELRDVAARCGRLAEAFSAQRDSGANFRSPAPFEDERPPTLRRHLLLRILLI